jgi:hypothetical protein
MTTLNYQMRSLLAEDVVAITPQPAQQFKGDIRRDIATEHWTHLSALPHQFTALCDDSVLACGGFIWKWKGVVDGWVLLSERVGPDGLLWLHRNVLKMNEGLYKKYGKLRIQTTVREDFRAGHRWAKMLGFEPEGLMRQYDPDGKDHRLYARIQ